MEIVVRTLASAVMPLTTVWLFAESVNLTTSAYSNSLRDRLTGKWEERAIRRGREQDVATSDYTDLQLYGLYNFTLVKAVLEARSPVLACLLFCAGILANGFSSLLCRIATGAGL